MIHHIIPKHEWKKRFGALTGVNAPDNLVVLTLAQHMQVHELLYEINDCVYDKIAYLCLSGRMGHEEAQILATKAANSGNKYCQGKKNSLGFRHSSEFKEAQRQIHWHQ
jgi:hypothetical protein